MCAPDVPDPGPEQLEAVKMQKEIAEKQLALQDRMFTYFQDRQGPLDEMQQRTSESQLALAAEAEREGRDIFEYQKAVFRPAEMSLVSEAMRDSTPEHYAKYAAEAATRIGAQQEVAQGTFNRNARSLGINPNSGAYMAGQRGLQLEQAGQRAAGMNEARDRAEALSFARRADVAGIGKGLVGAGNASYGLAIQGTSSALTGANDTTRTAAATLGTPAQYGGAATQAGLNMGNLANDIYRTQVGAASGGNDALFGALGTAFGGWASSGFAM
jgi:hypothetical protein